jgi:hypothetical protein
MVHYVMKDGKVSGGEIPYFDLRWPEGGLVGAVWWSGQWEIQISRDSSRKITLQARQQDVHLRLHPGESIRTPSLLLVQWAGAGRDAAWQFNRPEEGDGIVQAFRQDKSEDAAKDLRLRGLDAAATYQVADLDSGGLSTVTGKDLMDKGLQVEVAGERRSSSTRGLTSISEFSELS